MKRKQTRLRWRRNSSGLESDMGRGRTAWISRRWSGRFQPWNLQMQGPDGLARPNYFEMNFRTLTDAKLGANLICDTESA